MSAHRLRILILLIGTASGCTTRVADFTAISTKNIYPKGIDISALPKQEGIEALDVGFLWIGASVSDAIDKALERGQGNLMIDCVIYDWAFLFIRGWKVRGTVVNVPYTSVSSDRGKIVPGGAARLARAKESRAPVRTQSPWSRLRRGLAQEDVRALIGEPSERSVSTKSTVWFYPDTSGGYVLFKSERVHSWRAP